MHGGHAYAGCWLEERTLPDAASDGADTLQHIRKLEADALITVFETTLIAGEPPSLLVDAERAARPHLVTENPFRLALDVHRARISRIVPLPIPGEKPVGAEDGSVAVVGPAGIGDRVIVDPIDPASKAPTKTATRIDQWKSRLLDLTLRNRLLNFRETKSTIRILSAVPEHVEDGLAAEKELALCPRSNLMSAEDPRHGATLSDRQRTDALAEHLTAELKQGRLHTHLEEREHARRLTELYRSARNALDENGTNTLFAAVGFLEWRETEHSDRIFRAPLLLVPVELKRKSVIEGFSLRRIDEETRLNVTLMEMLRQNFQKEVPGLDPLPEDETGVNVGRVFQIFRDAVRNLPGWEVKSEIWLGQFSFTKFLLWKDLADRLEDLTRNRVVQHLVEGSGAPYPHVPTDIQPHELDDHFHPRDIFCPRSADSSQLAAVMAAAAGHDFVLEGPPGTGKSQTITNIIAHCLAHGKRVLFVAEKRAALDVVHRRLREEGLEPFCLELHSNKTGKGEVLAQFQKSLDVLDAPQNAEWEERATELASVRTILNGYARALHERLPCGLSAYSCFDYLLPRKEEPTVRLDGWTDILGTSRATLERARDVSRLLRERALPLGELHSHLLAEIGREDWSPAWSEGMLDRLRAFRPLIGQLEAAADALGTWLKVPSPRTSLTQLYDLAYFAEALSSPAPVGPRLASVPWSRLSTEIDTWSALAGERATLRGQLRGFDERRLLALGLDALQQRLQTSEKSWFLPKWLGRNAVRKEVQSARADGAKVEPARLADLLSQATRLRVVNTELAASQSAAVETLGALWREGEPSAEDLGTARAWGETLHSRLVALAGDDLEWLERLRQHCGALFREGPATFGPNTAIGARFVNYLNAFAGFVTGFNGICDELTLRREGVDNAGNHITAVRALIERCESGWGHLRSWCAWQKIRSEALGMGLAPLVGRIEEGIASVNGMPELFERSFRRALLFAVIERDTSLRGFFGTEHAERIERFRKLDENLNQLARESIHARLAARVPRQDSPDVPKSEIGLLRKELGKKMRHIPVRRLLGGIPSLLPRLKPCVLMSPLSVAQYLDSNHEHFDVVIFDEASQIPVWDAIGAIARGSQLIVVGDPKQLPPTNFFGRSEDEDEQLPPENEDLESILDELLSAGLRHKRLRWHYRSRHEGLIAFSNRQYYENDLLTFPSPETELGGVRFRHIPEAHYDKGKSRTNPGEARALVDEIVRRLRDPLEGRKSYGVVTFSMAQQELVEDLLDQKRREHPEIEIHFGDAPPVESEPVFVKNLENVQGDERDVILFSVCYGQDESGKVSMNFGPLNREGGERRLNVAITRAKHEVLVFSGLRGDQIDLTRTRSRGVRDLKHFLEYAERGPKALAAASSASTDAVADSEFERLVADRIRAAGFEVHHQVGCSGYRIDLGIVDPKAQGRYILGVECDGATYHRAATARDRDKLRQLVLEGLGWRLHRIWSTDWWHDAEGQTTNLLQVLKEISNVAE
jgi:very-short-patch-repair endonuclease